jgi:hypothetical protein
MSSQTKVEYPAPISGVVFVILALAMWAASFSHTCRSDGCIGLIFPAGASAVALAIQVLVLIPLYAYRRHKAGATLFPAVAIWAGMSIAAFAVPLAFVK